MAQKGRISGGPRLLVTDRNVAIVLERARVHQQGERVVFHAADDKLVRRFNIPHCNLALLLLGQGTSITQEAAARLAEENVYVAFTGTGGTPLHMGSLITYKATAHFRRMLPVYSSEGASLAAARSIMSDRTAFMTKHGLSAASKLAGLASPDAVIAACRMFDHLASLAPDTARLMGAEGEYAKAIYREFVAAAMRGKFTRKPGSDGELTRQGSVNRFIDHGNYLAYGVAGAAIWALGIPPHMSVIHGRTRPGGLVFDIADAWKDSVIIPAAVKASAKGDEKMFRAMVIDLIEDLELLRYSIAVLERAITAGETFLQGIDQPPF